MTPVRYQEFLNEFGSKYAQDTIERTHYHIKSAVKIAVRDQLIPSNFTEGAVVKSQKEKSQKLKAILKKMSISMSFQRLKKIRNIFHI